MLRSRHAQFAVAASLLVACSTTSPPTASRPLLPCPPEVAEPRVVPPPQLVHGERTDDGRFVGELQGLGEHVHFSLWRTRTGSQAAAPLILLVPILAGGEELMVTVASELLDRGFDVALCKRVASAMKEPQRGPELEQLFHRTVLHQRLLLAWLRAGDQPPPALCVLGISLGGMVATAIAAAEPDLTAVTICLSGGDVADLVVTSSENRVQRWRHWRHEADGVGDDHVRQDVLQNLRHEPLRTAHAVATEKVLFITGTLDTVVPTRHQDLLWEALGRPQRFCVPFGHYSAFLVLPEVVEAAAEHFRRCIPHPVPRPAGVTAAAPPCTSRSGPV
jgi:pimeloyl-ACP methyl ester carboxylesterase